MGSFSQHVHPPPCPGAGPCGVTSGSDNVQTLHASQLGINPVMLMVFGCPFCTFKHRLRNLKSRGPPQQYLWGMYIPFRNAPPRPQPAVPLKADLRSAPTSVWSMQDCPWQSPHHLPSVCPLHGCQPVGRGWGPLTYNLRPISS